MNLSEKSSVVLSLNNVTFYYKKRRGYFKYETFCALKEISFDLYQGETLGIIGKNGVGKTTLLKILAGIFAPDEGIVKNNGYSTCMLSLQAGFLPHLTGRENACLSGMILGMKWREIQERLAEIKAFSGLGDFFDQPISSYSTGMTARLGFSVALQLNHDVLLIDEVLGVGDEEFRHKSTQAMKQKITSNKTVVIVSHVTPTIRELCDRVIWIDEGIVKASGNTADVLQRYLNTIKQS